MKLSEYIKNNDKELTEEQVQKLNEILGPNKNWKPKECECYRYINSGGEIERDFWSGGEWDEYNYSIGNIFKTEEEANFELEKRKLLIELQRFADENNDEINWKNKDQTKFFLYCDRETGNILIDYNITCQSINAIYFSSKELAQKAIDIYGDRIKKYLVEVDE